MLKILIFQLFKNFALAVCTLYLCMGRNICAIDSRKKFADAGFAINLATHVKQEITPVESPYT